MKPEAQRTLSQNAAFHLWFKQVSDVCKQEGVTFSQYVKMRPKLEMYWSPFLVKELYKTAQKAMYGTESTTELTRKQVNELYEVVSKALSETLGITPPPFPSFETLIE